ncbi:hypothetical protein LTR85_009645 [Meristemomyces frigidus]|nr:hypothetical protein LTR85_009645 [Meristemomyces frigidus]
MNSLASRAGALRALKTLLAASSAMGSSSPDDVLQNFVTILKNTSPSLRLAILFSTPWVMLVMALARNNIIAKGCTSVQKFFTSKLTASVSIPGSHPLQKQIMAYMVNQGLGKNARTLALTSPQNDSKMSGPFAPYYAYYGMQSDSTTDDSEEDTKRDQPTYVPDFGKYPFTYQGYSMTFEKQEPLSQSTVDARGKVRMTTPKENSGPVILSCRSLFASAKPIQDFLTEIKTSAAASRESMTQIFRPEICREGAYWDDGVARPARNLAAVTLDAEIQEPLVRDVVDYLDPNTRKFYIANAIPYRRGYLFYGPPGTGKTTMATAIAGEYGLNVYLLSLSNEQLNDRWLESLFDRLPAKCIVLLEDIDSAGIEREDMTKANEKKQKKKNKRRSCDDDDEDDEDNEQQGITLSALLNVLDGIASAEGRIILMTSNFPDSLDKALIRPGRIDRKVLFGYASHEVAGKLFTRIFTKTADQLRDGEQPFSEDIPALAKAFADQIPLGAITPAEVQGHLLQNRTDPVAAVQKAGEFARVTLEAKIKGANVASFANEVTAGPKGLEVDTSDCADKVIVDANEPADDEDAKVNALLADFRKRHVTTTESELSASAESSSSSGKQSKRGKRSRTGKKGKKGARSAAQTTETQAVDDKAAVVSSSASSSAASESAPFKRLSCSAGSDSAPPGSPLEAASPAPSETDSVSGAEDCLSGSCDNEA